MSYTITENKIYTVSADTLTQAALGAIEGLEGKLLDQKNSDEATQINAKFHKTIHGNVLGDRTHLSLNIVGNSPDQSEMTAEIYPLDAVGRKLKFGARAGVSQTVMTWLLAHIDHRLPD